MRIPKKLYPIGLIVAFSFLVHLPGITSPLLDYHAWRQCDTSSMARNYVRHGMNFLNTEVDAEGPPHRVGMEFPVYSYLLAILYKLFGVHEILGRLLSCTFAAWGAIFLYQLVRSRLNEKVALWSALAITTVPLHIYFTRTVQRESMALWAFLGFLLYCDRWLNPKQVHGETTGTRHTAPFLALLLGATASLIILPFLYSIFLMLAFLGFERYGRQAWKKSSLLLFLAGIVGLTAAWYAYANTASTVVIPLSRQTYAEFMRFIFTWRLWKVHLISRFPELCATYSGLLLGGIGACQLWRREGRRSIFWFYWFGATIVHISLLGRYGLVHEYTDLPFAPVTAVFIGAGIVYAWDMARNRKIWQTAVILLVIGVPVHAALRIKHWYRLDRLWVFRARGVVARLSQPDDLVITNSPGIGPTINYHIDRYGWGVNLEDNGVSQIQMYRTQGARFFLTAVDPSWLQHPEWTTYFSQHAKLLYQDPEFLIYEFTDRGKVSAPS